MDKLKFFVADDTRMKTRTRIWATIASITAIDKRKYSERGIN